MQKKTVSIWNIYGGHVLWLPVFALTAIGILFVYSSSAVLALHTYHSEWYFVKRQCMALLPALFLAWIGATWPINWFYKYALWIFILSILTVLATHVPDIGRRVGGAPRWLNTWPVAVQPSEFLKAATVLYCVSLLCLDSTKTSQWWRWVILGMSPLAVLSQKDLGTTFVIACGILAMLFISGLRARYFIGISIFGLIGLVGGVILEPYRLGRVFTFLDPFADSRGAGFQIIQSFLAVSNGGWFGLGIGESHQKLFFLPEAHTDFIMAVIAEEMGLVGIIGVSLLYIVLYYAVFCVVKKSITASNRFLATGIFTILTLSTLTNMGVVVGALPTKGLPLPFISNGGSALVANYFLIGLISQLAARFYVKQESA